MEVRRLNNGVMAIVLVVVEDGLCVCSVKRQGAGWRRKNAHMISREVSGIGMMWLRSP